MRLGQVGMGFLQASAKKRLLKGATTYSLEFNECCVLDKEKSEVQLLNSAHGRSS